MKLIIFFALVSLARSAPAINEGIQNDIADFMEVIPIEKIKKIAIKHLHDDPEFQAAVQYLKSPEWKEMSEELMATPEVKELLLFMNESGIDIKQYGKVICSFFKDVKVETNHTTKSLKSFIEEVRQIIPVAKLIQLFSDKMVNSPAFKELYMKFTDERPHKIVDKVRALPVFQKMVAEIKIMGIDIDQIFKIVYGVLGWQESVPSQKI